MSSLGACRADGHHENTFSFPMTRMIEENIKSSQFSHDNSILNYCCVSLPQIKTSVTSLWVRGASFHNRKNRTNNRSCLRG